MLIAFCITVTYNLQMLELSKKNNIYICIYFRFVLWTQGQLWLLPTLSYSHEKFLNFTLQRGKFREFHWKISSATNKQLLQKAKKNFRCLETSECWQKLGGNLPPIGVAIKTVVSPSCFLLELLSRVNLTSGLCQ